MLQNKDVENMHFYTRDKTIKNNANFNMRDLCISTSVCMLAHAFAWSKMVKNALKLSKTYFFCHEYERLM